MTDTAKRLRARASSSEVAAAGMREAFYDKEDAAFDRAVADAIEGLEAERDEAVGQLIYMVDHCGFCLGSGVTRSGEECPDCRGPRDTLAKLEHKEAGHDG